MPARGAYGERSLGVAAVGSRNGWLSGEDDDGVVIRSAVWVIGYYDSETRRLRRSRRGAGRTRGR